MLQHQDRAEERPDPEKAAPPAPGPPCPECSSHETRLSRKKGFWISVARRAGFTRYKCRTCGNRFFSGS